MTSQKSSRCHKAELPGTTYRTELEQALRPPQSAELLDQGRIWAPALTLLPSPVQPLYRQWSLARGGPLQVFGWTGTLTPSIVQAPLQMQHQIVSSR